MSRNPKIDPLRQCKKDGINFIAIKKEKEVTLNPLLIDVCDSYLLIYGRPATLPVGTCLTLYSSLSASLFVIAELAPTNSTGLRDLVYFAPLPKLCAINRFFRSLVIPQYRDSSEHRIR